MLGRGIDQILPFPGDPQLYEPCVDDARDYLVLAEAASGPIPRPVDFGHVWGDALAAWRTAAPDARIVNLETSITTSRTPLPKGINYKMEPRNAPCLTAAGIDCCTLANNHVLDWGAAGLGETLETLDRLGIARAGAGRNEAEAAAPAVIPLPGGRRVMVFAFGTESSGIPADWAATADTPGVNLLPDLSQRTAERIAAAAAAVRRPGDLIVASIHWGGNWGYGVPDEQRRFAHALIDLGAADVVHGHSAHHAKAIEVHAGRPILYGCGDFINDYEGIAGYEGYRGDIAVSYLPRLDQDGRLISLGLIAFVMRRFALHQAPSEDVRWLRGALDRESAAAGTRIDVAAGNRLAVRW